MERPMLIAVQGLKILAAVIGPHVVYVMNMILNCDPSVKNPVFVGFQVLGANAPTQPNITMRGVISARRAGRNLRSRRNSPNRNGVPGFTARAAKLFLCRAGNRGATHGTWLRGHTAILQVAALCHATFGGVSNFDKHRRNGRCLDVTEIGLVEDKYRVWRAPGPENAWWKEASA